MMHENGADVRLALAAKNVDGFEGKVFAGSDIIGFSAKGKFLESPLPLIGDNVGKRNVAC